MNVTASVRAALVLVLVVVACSGLPSSTPQGTLPAGSEETPIADRAPVEISPALDQALQRFDRFLISDDAERSDVLSQADDATLRDLVATMEPLYDEVNAVLDVLVAHPHPLPEDQDLLEEQLHSLGQAGMEAQFELEARGQ